MKKNILITGAANGIGWDLALQFSKKINCNIIAVSRNESRLKELKELINSDSEIDSILIPVGLDLKNTDLTPLIEKIMVFGHLDILINNAAILIKKEVMNINEKEIQELFDINFFAPLRLIKALHPYMGKSAKTHIVNISSMGGYQGTQKFPGMTIYSASKAALANLTEGLAVEFSKDNISVNCLALGSVQTEMLTNAFPNFKAPITSEKMANFIMDFSLTGHEYFNGKILPVALTTP